MESISIRKNIDGMNKDELDSYARETGKILEYIINKVISDKDCISLIEVYLDHYLYEFIMSTAASRHHHAYPGGLMDHTLEVVNICNKVAPAFPGMDVDILLTGAMLHDIGKPVCYEESPLLKSGKTPKVRFRRSKESKILGHFGEALQMIDKMSNAIELDKDKRDAIKHIVASHHGPVAMRWGSLVDPATPEANLVHFADMISSRVGGEE